LTLDFVTPAARFRSVLVTALFADVKGSMALAEQVDPEEWHGILDRFFQILADGVHRFEGTVNQYTGDGVMPLFGAPIAYENHAQRACYAALHLRDELRRYGEELKRTRGLGLAVRIGLMLGRRTVTGSMIGSPAQADRMLRLAAEKEVRAKAEVFPLDGVNTVLDRVAQGALHATEPCSAWDEPARRGGP